MTESQLIRKAVKLFPIVGTVNSGFGDNVATVRYNRRSWVKAVQYLRTASSTGWILDAKISRLN